MNRLAEQYLNSLKAASQASTEKEKLSETHNDDSEGANVLQVNEVSIELGPLKFNYRKSTEKSTTRIRRLKESERVSALESKRDEAKELQERQRMAENNSEDSTTSPSRELQRPRVDIIV